MSQSIDYKALESLEKDLKALLNSIPNARKQLHEEYAAMAKELVDANIKATVNDPSGKVSGWQEARVGSGGGYAAVSATASSTGKNSPGAITNYLENGHAIRKPSGKDPHYRPRIHVAGRVDGRHFYHNASLKAQRRAIDIAEKFVNKLADKLEGK